MIVGKHGGGSRPYRNAPVLGRSNWLHSFTRKSRGYFVCLQSASRRCAEAALWRAAFPRGISTVPMLTGTAIVFPDRQSYKPHPLAKWHERKPFRVIRVFRGLKHFHLPSSILHPLCFRRAFSEDHHHRRRPARRFHRAGRQTPETRAPDRGFRPPSRQPERL